MTSTTANNDHDLCRTRPLSAAPSVASIGPYTSRPYISQRSQPGPSASARTSFTRVGPEEEEGPLFPARPATASASVATPQLQLLRPRLFDLPSAESATSLQIDANVDSPDLNAPVDTTMPSSTAPPSSSTAPPSSQQPQPPAVPQTPQTYITFLLVTGRRRAMSFEPETTVGRVKELVWNTWPEEDEWRDERPPAPSYLRLLYLGKMLQDEDTLTKLKLPVSNPSTPQGTIVHLSIRPHAPTGETDGLKKKRKLPRRLSGDGERLSIHSWERADHMDIPVCRDVTFCSLTDGSQSHQIPQDVADASFAELAKNGWISPTLPNGLSSIIPCPTTPPQNRYTFLLLHGPQNW